MTQNAFSLSREDWKSLLDSKGMSPHVLPFWLNRLYRNSDFWEKHISKDLLINLKQEFHFDLPEISTLQESHDGTVKFLMKLKDQLEVETVLIPFHKRFTVCLSTQVGCAMNCSFCYTGTQGLKRNLSAGEIVGQYLMARNWLLSKNENALNPSIVFMGQGEPLQNVVEVKKSIEILNDPSLIGVGHRQMTLSTVGYVPGMKSLKDFPKINFALSLHSPFEEERSLLIPVNEKYPLNDILKHLDELSLLPKQFINFEYLLIKDFNMSVKHADALKDLLGDRPAIMNLIPFNSFPGSKWERPEISEIEMFKQELVKRSLRVMVRTTKGSDILAACGQLKVKKLARKNGL